MQLIWNRCTRAKLKEYHFLTFDQNQVFEFCGCPEAPFEKEEIQGLMVEMKNDYFERIDEKLEYFTYIKGAGIGKFAKEDDFILFFVDRHEKYQEGALMGFGKIKEISCKPPQEQWNHYKQLNPLFSEQEFNQFTSYKKEIIGIVVKDFKKISPISYDEFGVMFSKVITADNIESIYLNGKFIDNFQEYLSKEVTSSENEKKNGDDSNFNNPIDTASISTKKPILPTIGIVTALPEEEAAILALLDNAFSVSPKDAQGAGKTFYIGEMPALNGKKHCIALMLGGQGTGEIGVLTSILLNNNPTIKIIIKVGISGGVPNPAKVEEDVRLGDVVVSNGYGVIEYDYTKKTATSVNYRIKPRPPNPYLLEVAKKLQTEYLYPKHRPWNKHIETCMTKLNISQPPLTKDILIDPNNQSNITKIIKRKTGKTRYKREPKIFLGPIGSSNTLLRDPFKRDELRDLFEIKAVEMEGAGVAEATYQTEKHYMLICGINDYCDKNKNDIWKQYAAAVAAGYTRALLESSAVFE